MEISRDHDDECGVDVTLSAGTFSGAGHAWLHIADIEAFSSQCRRLADTSVGEARLTGGYAGDLTIDVALRPLGGRGHILAVAKLSTRPPDLDAKIYAPALVSGGLIVEPAELSVFAKSLTDIPRGGSVNATMRGQSAA